MSHYKTKGATVVTLDTPEGDHTEGSRNSRNSPEALHGMPLWVTIVAAMLALFCIGVSKHSLGTSSHLRSLYDVCFSTKSAISDTYACIETPPGTFGTHPNPPGYYQESFDYLNVPEPLGGYCEELHYGRSLLPFAVVHCISFFKYQFYIIIVGGLFQY